jgi:hypothetical protein
VASEISKRRHPGAGVHTAADRPCDHRALEVAALSQRLPDPEYRHSTLATVRRSSIDEHAALRPDDVPGVHCPGADPPPACRCLFSSGDLDAVPRVLHHPVCELVLGVLVTLPNLRLRL